VSGEVKDSIAAGQLPGQSLPITQVSHGVFDRQPRDISLIASGTNERPDLVTFSEQCAYNITADESGCAGDECQHNF